MEENKNLWIGAILVIGLLLLFGSFGMGGGYGMMGGFGLGFGWIFMVLFWGAIIWLIFSLIRAAQSGPKGANEEDAQKILKRRYASGEISKKQFEKMRKELRGGYDGHK